MPLTLPDADAVRLALDTDATIMAARSLMPGIAEFEVSDRIAVANATAQIAVISAAQRRVRDIRATTLEAGRAEMRTLGDVFREHEALLDRARRGMEEKLTEWWRVETTLSDGKRDLEAERQIVYAERAGLPAPTNYIPPPPTTYDTPDGGSVTVTHRWTYDITNPDLVPREFCEPSRGKLRAAVNNGARSIPGLSIHEDTSTSHRAFLSTPQGATSAEADDA